jgi:Spy/CpxP family protein refolding chaperone
MKKLMILTLVLLSLGFVQQSFAQQTKTRFPVLRERLANAKFEYVREKLALSTEQAEQLRPIYMAFEKEQAQLGAIRKLRLNNVNADSISDEAALDLMTARLDFAQKQLDLRKKYMAEYKKVLTPQQIIKLQQCEVEIRQKVLLELRNRKQGGRFQ